MIRRARHATDPASVEARRLADVHAALLVLTDTAHLPASRELYRELLAAGVLDVPERAA